MCCNTYKIKQLKPMPTELAPFEISMISRIKTPPQKPVWKQFMVRKVPGFSASRRKRRIASTSINSTMTMNSMNTTTDLENVRLVVTWCACCNLRNGWLDDILKVVEVP
jgi:hypothetical protein